MPGIHSEINELDGLFPWKCFVLAYVCGFESKWNRPRRGIKGLDLLRHRLSYSGSYGQLLCCLLPSQRCKTATAHLGSSTFFAGPVTSISENYAAVHCESLYALHGEGIKSVQYQPTWDNPSHWQNAFFYPYPACKEEPIRCAIADFHAFKHFLDTILNLTVF